MIPFDTEEEAIRHGERLAVRALRLDLDPRSRPGDPRRQGHPHRQPERELAPAACSHEAPFGGYKQSGMGREMGMHAVALYTEVKNIYFSQE